MAVNTGTSALEILMMLKAKPGQKVAVPTNTNFASVAAILHNNMQPIYLDMEATTFCASLKTLKHAHAKHPDLAGVMWVHIGGIIGPDFVEVAAYCRQHGLFLVEDAAHAHGSRLRGIKAGAFADGGAFSFFPTKVMTTMEGGMITLNDEHEVMLAKSIRNQGKRGGNYGGLHHDLGSSWRLSEIAACIGLVMLAKLDRMVAARTEAARRVEAVLNEMGLAYCGTRHMDAASYYKLIVQVPKGRTADELGKLFAADSVILGGGVYPLPCHLQPVFAHVAYDADDVAVAEALCPWHICPPITSGTSAADTDLIIAALRKHLS